MRVWCVYVFVCVAYAAHGLCKSCLWFVYVLYGLCMLLYGARGDCCVGFVYVWFAWFVYVLCLVCVCCCVVCVCVYCLRIVLSDVYTLFLHVAYVWRRVRVRVCMVFMCSNGLWMPTYGLRVCVVLFVYFARCMVYSCVVCGLCRFCFARCL